jgi:membrane protein CcdC involved in cytochrome C biogenesis
LFVFPFFRSASALAFICASICCTIFSMLSIFTECRSHDTMHS